MNQNFVRVFFTPLKNDDEYVASEIEATDFIFDNGLSSVTEFIDSEDYDIGIFSFGDVIITGDNSRGQLNNGDDWRSIFPFTRDLCKVRVEYVQQNTDTGTESSTNIFQGLINEEASRADLSGESVVFSVLSRDSILRKVNVAEGFIQSTTLASDALKNILNLDKIKTVLAFDPGNVTVDNDVTIDDGSFFDNLPVKDAIDSLLLGTNSVLTINDSAEVFVSARTESSASVVDLFGKDSIDGQENITNIFDLNDGTQRMFNSVVVNVDLELNDDTLITSFGARQKTVDLGWVTTQATEISIGNRILGEFKVPKQEVRVVVDAELGKDISILDPIRVTYPHRLVPQSGTFLPVYDQTEYDDADYEYPQVLGDIDIDPDIKWKVIEKETDVQNQIITLKLRQVGKTFIDGFFSSP